MRRFFILISMPIVLSACQSRESSFKDEMFSDETRATEAQLMNEARAFGAAQGAVGVAAAFDPTGAAGLVAMPVGLAARNAWMASANQRMKAQVDRDLEASYRRYGMNPDGTPSGKRPTE